MYTRHTQKTRTHTKNETVVFFNIYITSDTITMLKKKTQLITHKDGHYNKAVEEKILLDDEEKKIT